MSAQAAHSLAEVLIYLMTSIPIGLIIAGPTSADQYALAGAALAAMLAALHALERRKRFLHLTMVILSSAGVGTLGPGFLIGILNFIWPASSAYLATALSWHTYAVTGLFFGLGGWAIVNSILHKWEVHADAVAARPFKFLDPRNDEPDENP